MKKISISISTFLLLFVTGVVYAQNNENSWLFTAGINILDIRVPTTFQGFVKDYLNGSVQDLNYYGAPLRMTAEKRLNKGLSIQAAMSINELRRGFYKNYIPLTNSKFFMIDAKLKYALTNLFNKKSGWFDPFVGIGFGYSFIKDYPSGNDFKIGAGAGANTWFSDSFGLSFESYYHHNFKNQTPTGTDFFQHSIGLIYRPYKKDTDGDLIIDKLDKCPNVFGEVEFEGCPPPDSDNDGVIDSEDACPKTAGMPRYKGCPDSDGDTIIDSEDKCPKMAGPKVNGGCPWKDTDGDGIIDKEDACPDVYGDIRNNGCPKKKSK